MKDIHATQPVERRTSGRRGFLQAAAAAGAGLVLAGAGQYRAQAATLGAPGDCTESVQDILDAALTAEQIAVTLYYTALTSVGIIGHPYLAGTSGDPNNVSPNGNAANVAYLQGALDAEQKHAQMLMQAGAKPSHSQFFFPAGTFDVLGYTRAVGTFLWSLDHIETAFIGAYLAAINRFGVLGHPDLAQLAGRILGTECEHRALGRVIAGDDPANNVTLEVVSFACVGSVTGALSSYITGEGFSLGAAPAVAMPDPTQTAKVIGKHTTTV